MDRKGKGMPNENMEESPKNKVISLDERIDNELNSFLESKISNIPDDKVYDLFSYHNSFNSEKFKALDNEAIIKKLESDPTISNSFSTWSFIRNLNTDNFTATEISYIKNKLNFKTTKNLNNSISNWILRDAKVRALNIHNEKKELLNHFSISTATKKELFEIIWNMSISEIRRLNESSIERKKYLIEEWILDINSFSNDDLYSAIITELSIDESNPAISNFKKLFDSKNIKNKLSKEDFIILLSDENVNNDEKLRIIEKLNISISLKEYSELFLASDDSLVKRFYTNLWKRNKKEFLESIWSDDIWEFEEIYNKYLENTKILLTKENLSNLSEYKIIDFLDDHIEKSETLKIILDNVEKSKKEHEETLKTENNYEALSSLISKKFKNISKQDMENLSTWDFIELKSKTLKWEEYTEVYRAVVSKNDTELESNPIRFECIYNSLDWRINLKNKVWNNSTFDSNYIWAWEFLLKETREWLSIIKENQINDYINENQIEEYPELPYTEANKKLLEEDIERFNELRTEIENIEDTKEYYFIRKYVKDNLKSLKTRFQREKWFDLSWYFKESDLIEFLIQEHSDDLEISSYVDKEMKEWKNSQLKDEESPYHNLQNQIDLVYNLSNVTSVLDDVDYEWTKFPFKRWLEFVWKKWKDKLFLSVWDYLFDQDWGLRISLVEKTTNTVLNFDFENFIKFISWAQSKTIDWNIIPKNNVKFKRIWNNTDLSEVIWKLTSDNSLWAWYTFAGNNKFYKEELSTSDSKYTWTDILISSNNKSDESLIINSVNKHNGTINISDASIKRGKWEKDRDSFSFSEGRDVSFAEFSDIVNSLKLIPYEEKSILKKKAQENEKKEKIKGWIIRAWFANFHSLSDIWKWFELWQNSVKDILGTSSDIHAAKVASVIWWFTMIWEVQDQIQIKNEQAEKEMLEKTMSNLKWLDSAIATRKILKYISNKNTYEPIKEACLLFVLENYWTLYTKDLYEKKWSFLWYEAMGWKKWDSLYLEVEAICNNNKTNFTEEELLLSLIWKQCKWIKSPKRRSKYHKDFKRCYNAWIEDERKKWSEDAWTFESVEWRINYAFWELTWWTAPNAVWAITQIIQKWNGSMKDIETIPFCMMASWVAWTLDWGKIWDKIKNDLAWTNLTSTLWFMSKKDRIEAYMNTILELSKDIQEAYPDKFWSIIDDTSNLYSSWKNNSWTEKNRLYKSRDFWDKYWDVISSATLLSNKHDSEFWKTDKIIMLKQDENPIYAKFMENHNIAFSWIADYTKNSDNLADPFLWAWTSWANLIKSMTLLETNASSVYKYWAGSDAMFSEIKNTFYNFSLKYKNLDEVSRKKLIMSMLWEFIIGILDYTKKWSVRDDIMLLVNNVFNDKNFISNLNWGNNALIYTLDKDRLISWDYSEIEKYADEFLRKDFSKIRNYETEKDSESIISIEIWIREKVSENISE